MNHLRTVLNIPDCYGSLVVANKPKTTRTFRAAAMLLFLHYMKCINTRWEATYRVTAAKLIILIHKVVTQLHLVVESCTICRSCSRWQVRKLLDTPSYF